MTTIFTTDIYLRRDGSTYILIRTSSPCLVKTFFLITFHYYFPFFSHLIWLTMRIVFTSSKIIVKWWLQEMYIRTSLVNRTKRKPCPCTRQHTKQLTSILIYIKVFFSLFFNLEIIMLSSIHSKLKCVSF